MYTTPLICKHTRTHILALSTEHDCGTAGISNRCVSMKVPEVVRHLHLLQCNSRQALQGSQDWLCAYMYNASTCAG